MMALRIASVLTPREQAIDAAVRRVVGRIDPDDGGQVLLECLCAVQSVGSAILGDIRAEFRRIMAQAA